MHPATGAAIFFVVTLIAAGCYMVRQRQVKAAVRFCEGLFGHDYASLMNRAAENAMTGERKSSRAG